MPGTQAAKRKKTADMTDSPPKRVTRARAKNTTTDDVAPKPKATRIITASAKAAALKKKPAAPTELTKRKTRADDEDGEATKGAVLEQQTRSEPTKGKGRVRVDVTGEKEEIQVLDAPKTKARPTKGTAAEVTKPDGPKPRGRPKKALETAPMVSEAHDEIPKPVPVKKATRGRPVVNATEVQSTAPVTRLGAPAQKKRVKFQEEPDKENVPIETKGMKKSAIKPTGLKAKPVRKPVPVRATARGRKGTKPSAPQSLELEKKDVLPLSPKKVNQVAKSDPIFSEDELAGEKTPITPLSKSPAKQNTSPAKYFGSASKLNYDQTAAPSSPSKPNSSSILASPARRPPPSPFKEALKLSPKKLQLGDTMAQPVLLPSRTPMKGSLLQESPKRGILGDNMTQPILLPSKSPFKMSLLQESPKRVKIEDKASQLIQSPSRPQPKASLLQSPARRPIVSPVKSTGLESPAKSGKNAPVFHTTITSRQSSPSKAPSSSPKKVVHSPFRASSPEQTNQVDTFSDGVREMVADEEVIPVSHAEELTMKDPSETDPSLRTPIAIFEEPMSFDDTIVIDQPETVICSGENLESTAIAENNMVFKGPSFSLASAALRRVSFESGSEDELASPDKGYGVTPLRSHGVFAQDFATPAIVNAQDSDNSEDQLSFTPLADQLSTWAASSPHKQTDKYRRPARGMFSLGGAGTNATPEQFIGDIPTGSPAKSSFFEDEMAIRDGEDVEDSPCTEMDLGSGQNLAALQVSQESQASDEYGDENAVPSEAEFLRAEQDHTLTCTPAKVFTPAKRTSQQPREIHTVSKVPLRASVDDSPLIVTRPRSRSLGGPLSVVHDIHQGSALESEVHEDAENDAPLHRPATPVLVAATVPQTPGSALRLDAETPGRTARKEIVPDVLQGAVVFVDVHTSEGADASGIFVDLLTQMGARCVRQWSWNPRASMGGSLNSNNPEEASADTTKVGITHVVYKDGGKRTLEKVRSSNGSVSCVGVGWVLE